MVCWSVPLAASQTLTVPLDGVPSSDADASSFESCEKATEWTGLLWPSSVCSTEPVAVSQILTVLSSDPDASSFESGEKATEWTPLLWPSSVCWRELVAVSQILTVSSSDADASSFESGEKVTELTQSL
jgi:hypothetical protein